MPWVCGRPGRAGGRRVHKRITDRRLRSARGRPARVWTRQTLPLRTTRLRAVAPTWTVGEIGKVVSARKCWGHSSGGSASGSRPPAGDSDVPGRGDPPGRTHTVSVTFQADARLPRPFACTAVRLRGQLWHLPARDGLLRGPPNGILRLLKLTRKA